MLVVSQLGSAVSSQPDHSSLLCVGFKTKGGCLTIAGLVTRARCVTTWPVKHSDAPTVSLAVCMYECACIFTDCVPGLFSLRFGQKFANFHVL
jgi:hypothetical protein